MISICAPVFDLEGAFLLDELPGSTKLGEVSRRVSRQATLDGGASFEDQGSFDADRTFKIEARPKEGEDEALRRLVQTHRWLIVSTAEGVFKVAPSKAELSPRRIRLTLLVQEKRSE